MIPFKQLSHFLTILPRIPQGWGVRIKDLPMNVRPRERLISKGVDSLSDIDLIAILIRTGTREASAIAIAERLLSHFGSLTALAQADLSELKKTRGIGQNKAIMLKCAFVLALRMTRELPTDLPLLDTPEAIANLMRPELCHRRVETCYLILLNTRNRLIRSHQLTVGTLDSLLLHPREVFRLAILDHAARVALVHNHPSGDPSPSEADIRVTRDLVRVGVLMKIQLVDHVILGLPTKEKPCDYCSLRALGYLSS